MNIYVVGTLPDGKMLGKDNGTFYVGTPRQVSRDEASLVATVSEDGLSVVIVESISGQVISNNRITRGNMNDADWTEACNPTPQKLYRKVIVIDAEGHETEEQREVKRTVIDWAPLEA